MPSFEDMQRLTANVGTHGQQLKAMADDVMQQTWENENIVPYNRNIIQQPFELLGTPKTI